MIYRYYTYKSAQSFIEEINSYLKLCGWSDFFNTELRIKFETDGRVKVSKGLIPQWASLYWFEATIEDRERYTDINLKFQLSFAVKGFVLIQILYVIVALIACFFIQSPMEAFGAAMASSVFILFEAYFINLDKLRIKNNFAKEFELIEGPF